MAKFDADIKYILFNFTCPLVVLVSIAYYCIGLNVKKLEAFVQSRVCALLHRKYLEKDKELLFEGLADLKKNSREPINILEIGVGSGMNFKYYPKGTHLTCVDPNPYHEHYWKKNLQAHRNIRLIDSVHSGAEKMPDVESNSFDAVVCTLTLCSVKDPAAVLSEILRVLKPGGTFFFLEHVAAERGSFTRVVQNLIQTIWPYISSGCHLNRETWTYLDQSKFQTVQYRQYSTRMWLFFYVRPSLYGKAIK